MDFRRDSHTAPASEAILWDILESVSDAVVTIDEDHKVLLCNKAAEEMFGYRQSEIVGRDASPLIPNPHQSLHRGYVERYLNTGVPRVIGKARECYGQRRNGEIFPVEISYSVSRTGGRLFFTAVIRDISARKAMEREIRFMERLADVGKVVAHVVHEIRKPLMLIGGFARQVMQCRALENDEKGRHKLSIIVEETRRLEMLLNGIRLVTRTPGASDKRPLSVNELLRETLELLDPMLQNQTIEMQVDLAESPLVIKGDPDQLKQVFLNLMQNSLEAVGSTGTIRVTSRNLGAKAQITIEDNGSGIPEDLQDKVFDPFFTTKSEGTGLGLAICRNIIRDHEGSITFDSSLPHGTTFIVELPLEIP